MRTIDADVVHRAHALLGEGPVWDARDDSLWWVDALGAAVWRSSAGGHTRHETTEPLRCLVPRASGGFAGVVGSAFVAFDPATGVVGPLADTGLDATLNDGKCDPAGRFWAGSCGDGTGILYRLDARRQVTPTVGGITVSNGLAWSPDAGTLYYVDTYAFGIDAFDYDVATGDLRNRRRLVDIPESEGLADGMSVDSDGCLWVALFRSGCVRRYTPEGRLDGVVRTSCPQVTSCAFGGPGYASLYITSGAVGLDHPDAGALFVCTPGVTGLPPAVYAG
jgi:sugar lactone lactonase YvrE